MLRYADDMIVLLHKEEEKEFEEFLREIEGKYKLEVNREKTSKGGLKAGFDFLGFTIREETSKRQKKYLNIRFSINQFNQSMTLNKFQLFQINSM